MSKARPIKGPHHRYERQILAQGLSPVCGVDEAGRGPLAGPVVACAVILPEKGAPRGLDDSKNLTEAAREKLMSRILARCEVGIGMAEPEEIDRMNILAASLMAMSRAVAALPRPPAHALIDGNRSPILPCQHTLIIKGDAKSRSIAAASIVAKVTRDRLMNAAHIRFPGYGFAQNKGYPTAFHREAVKSLGPCPLHRRSFAPLKLWYC